MKLVQLNFIKNFRQSFFIGFLRLASLSLILSCDGMPTDEEDSSDSAAAEQATDNSDSNAGGSNPVCLAEGCDTTRPATACNTPTDIVSYQSPATIQQVVDLINVLPKPVTIYCFLEALQRPLFVNATNNTFSAQGATASNSPRIFLKKEGLVISFVPEGDGSQNIELAEETDLGVTIKGDLHFPISDLMVEASPYKSIYAAGEPACANLCHSSYKALKTFDDGTVKYESEQIFPKQSMNVTIAEMKVWRDQCDLYFSPLCDFYRSMFDHGELQSFNYVAPTP